MNRDILITHILSNAPYQLPPIHAGNGVFSLDVEYLGEKYCKIGYSLEEVLEGYFKWVTKINFIKPHRGDALNRAPIRPGSKLQQKHHK
jgi:hypothetical protein